MILGLELHGVDMVGVLAREHGAARRMSFEAALAILPASLGTAARALGAACVAMRRE